MLINIGLIGAGRMGATLARYLSNMSHSARLTAVADRELSRATEVAWLGQGTKIFADYRQLLAEDSLDAVVIATPTNTHAEVVKAAAAAGKHIFTEKPLALTLEKCDEAIAAVRSAGVKLQVGFMRRYDAAYVAAKERIEGGDIGTPILFKAIGRDSWRPPVEFARRDNSGGLMMDMGIHDFDLARWLMDSEVTRVYSEGDCQLYPELAEVGDIDNAIVNLKFASGAIGDVEISRSGLYGYDIRAEVVGTEGSLLVGELQQTAALILTRNGAVHDTYPGFMERFADSYAAEIQDFVAAIAENRQPAVSGADARAATAIGIAATRSLDEGRPVLLSEVE